MENLWPLLSIFHVILTSHFHGYHSVRPSASPGYIVTVASSLRFWHPDQVALSQVHFVGIFPKRYSPKAMDQPEPFQTEATAVSPRDKDHVSFTSSFSEPSIMPHTHSQQAFTWIHLYLTLTVSQIFTLFPSSLIIHWHYRLVPLNYKIEHDAKTDKNLSA